MLAPARTAAAVRAAAAVTALGVAFGAGVLVGAGTPAPPGALDEAARVLEAEGLEPVDRAALEQAAVSGMLEAAQDPWGGWNGSTRAARSAERSRPPATAVSVVPEPGGVPRVVVPALARGTADRVAAAVRGSGGALLDLRGTPGGELDEAVATAGAFLDGGPVARFARRDGLAQTLRAEPGGDVTTRLVVLVDGGTASAAEVVAGALQDRGRAVVVGERTFGKGLVQEPRRLAAGGQLTLTVGRWTTPSGRDVEGAGLVPDVEVPAGTAVGKALEVLRGLGTAR